MGEAARKDDKKEKRKFERLRVQISATVIARSIGSGITYKFVTHDVSAGGVFIRGEKSDYPFEERTLLEIWLHLDESTKTSTSFLGKIAHGREGGFGIKIVQIENDDQNVLNDFLKATVERHPELVDHGTSDGNSEEDEE